MGLYHFVFSVCLHDGIPFLNKTISSTNKHQKSFHTAVVADHNLQIVLTAYIKNGTKQQHAP